MKTTGMWTRDDGYKTFGALLPAQDAEGACRLADQVATAMNLTVHDGAHWTWPPASQRHNAAPLHQLRLYPVLQDGEQSPHWRGACSCGAPFPAEGEADRFWPDDIAPDWILHLQDVGALEE